MRNYNIAVHQHLTASIRLHNTIYKHTAVIFKHTQIMRFDINTVYYIDINISKCILLIFMNN